MRRWHIIVELVLIYVVPVLWFGFGFAPAAIQLFVFEGFIALLVVIAARHRFTPASLGFRRDTFWPTVRLLLPGMVVGLVILFALYQFGFNRYFFEAWWRNEYFLYYVTLGALSQEFAFRGYLLVRLRQLFQPRNPSSPHPSRSRESPFAARDTIRMGGIGIPPLRVGEEARRGGIILTNGLLFSLLHILHADISLAVGTFAFGSFLTWAMLRRPNLWAVTIAHIIVGGSAIILGFV